MHDYLEPLLGCKKTANPSQRYTIATEGFNDSVTDTTPTFITQCLPRNPMEKYLCDPHPNLPTKISRHYFNYFGVNYCILELFFQKKISCWFLFLFINSVSLNYIVWYAKKKMVCKRQKNLDGCFDSFAVE